MDNEYYGLPKPEESPDLLTDIMYLTEKRDNALDNFNDKIKRNIYNREAIVMAFESILRINAQLKIMEDCLVVSRITNANKGNGEKSL